VSEIQSKVNQMTRAVSSTLDLVHRNLPQAVGLNADELADTEMSQLASK
jgi:hypothetical protein